MKYWSKHVFTSFASIFLPGAVFFPKVICRCKDDIYISWNLLIFQRMSSNLQQKQQSFLEVLLWEIQWSLHLLVSKRIFVFQIIFWYFFLLYEAALAVKLVEFNLDLNLFPEMFADDCGHPFIIQQTNCNITRTLISDWVIFNYTIK